MIKFKPDQQDSPKPNQQPLQSKDQAGLGALPAEGSAAPIYPEKPPAHWLDLVVNLLSNCRKVSDKMKHRAGLGTYQHTLAAKGKAKLRTVGNIIDTRTEDKDTA